MYLVTTEQFEVDGELFYEGVSWKDYQKATKIIETKGPITYERLYNWYAVNNPKGLAPDGWHIASITELLEIAEYSRNNVEVLSSLFKGDILENIIWSQTESVDNSEMAFSIVGIYPPTNAIMIGTSTKWGYGSVRCIKNDSTYVSKLIDIDGNEYPTVKLGNQVWTTKNLAVNHYKNGDLIGSDFSGTEGAVAISSDEVYEIIEVEVESDDFVITYNGIDYVFPKDKVIETPRFTREQNIPFGEYQYRTHSDKHTEFFEPVKEYFGIDMKENYEAQFRDGINPHKDINGSIFKENPDQ